ncbi:ABC transporter substrate-binding protein [Oscillospiraceae bacterium 21-37]
MKNWRKVAALLLALALTVSMAACGGGENSSSTSATDSKTSSAVSTPAESSEASEPADESEPASSEAGEEEDDPMATATTPRNETLYYGGEQWGKPINMNPLSSNSGLMCMEQDDQATVIVWETLYMFNTIDSKAYPLLADGDYEWNEDRTQLTFKVKEAAKWDDGTPFTADDVVATWDAHVKYESATGIDFSQYIEGFEAVDEHTVLMKGKPVDDENYNPLKMMEYLNKVYMMQKAYLEKLDGELNGDSGEMKNATMWDAPITGAYRPTTYDSEQRVVFTRNDEYWGQDASMWGKLPVPKYIAHNMYKDNSGSARAFENGEIDINQQYVANLQDMWLEKDLPISTYYDEPPYQMAGTMPSIIFNTQKPGLDQKVVRQAIAMAIDYDQVVSSAMTGQSYTFTEVPRTLFNPTEPEQALIKDPEALKPYQHAGGDVEGANKLLDEAGITDTDGDGIREYEGQNLVFKAECPDGWSDYQAAINICAAAGQNIGISIEAYFPESATYTEDQQTGNFDIVVNGYAGGGISAPWLRAYQTMYGFGGNFPDTMTFNFSRYYNAEVDELLKQIPRETDEAKLKDMWEKLNIFYLDDVPAVSVMYRPINFHSTNETVWTNFPQADDETNIPPMICYDGYGYAAMFNLELVEG